MLVRRGTGRTSPRRRRRHAARVPATRSQPSSDPVNASADLTVSLFRAPVRRASPSCIRALVSAVLPCSLSACRPGGRQRTWTEVRLIPPGLSSGAALSKWPPWPGELILGPELPAVRGRRWIRAGALRGPQKRFVSVCESPLRHFPAYSTNRGRPAERRRFDVKSRFDAIAERAATR